MVTLRIIALSSILFAAACTPASKAAYKGVKQQAVVSVQEAADEKLATDEFMLCNSPTIGALKRRYSGNMDKYKEYYDFCDHDTPLGN